MKPTILLVSTNGWLSPVRIARAFADLDCRVQAVCPARNALTVSSAVRRTYLYRGFRAIVSIDAAIESADPDLVVPCDDLAAAHLHAIYEREALRGSPLGSGKPALLARSLGSPASYSIIDSRHELLSLARQEGVAVPNSALIPDLSALDGWLIRSGFPAVLKADCTSGGEGVAVVSTRLQAHRAFRELLSRRPTTRTFKRFLADGDSTSLARLRQRRPLLSVQQFVAGQDANVALACWQGEVLAQISAIVLKTRGFKGPAAVIRLVENSQMSTAVKKITRRLGLSGFAGFDFVIEERSGQAFLIEMNPRATQTCHLQLGARRSPSAALCASLAGRPVPKSPSAMPRETIVLWPHASKDLLATGLAEEAYFDTPRRDPEVVRLYGAARSSPFSHAMKSFWKAARAYQLRSVPQRGLSPPSEEPKGT